MTFISRIDGMFSNGFHVFVQKIKELDTRIDNFSSSLAGQLIIAGVYTAAVSLLLIKVVHERSAEFPPRAAVPVVAFVAPAVALQEGDPNVVEQPDVLPQQGDWKLVSSSEVSQSALSETDSNIFVITQVLNLSPLPVPAYLKVTTR